MPGWLQVIAYINPLSYVVDALRSLLLAQSYSRLGLDFGVLLLTVIIISLIGAKRYRRVVT